MSTTVRNEYRVETRTIAEGQETGWYPEGGSGRIFRTREKAEEFLAERRDWLDNPTRFEHRITARAVTDWMPVTPTVEFPR